MNVRQHCHWVECRYVHVHKLTLPLRFKKLVSLEREHNYVPVVCKSAVTSVIPEECNDPLCAIAMDTCLCAYAAKACKPPSSILAKRGYGHIDN